jgi:cytochrome c biogenesis protein CcdA
MNVNVLNFVLSIVSVLAIVGLGVTLLVSDVVPGLMGWRRYILVCVLFAYATIRLFRARKQFNRQINE